MLKDYQIISMRNEKCAEPLKLHIKQIAILNNASIKSAKHLCSHRK